MYYTDKCCHQAALIRSVFLQGPVREAPVFLAPFQMRRDVEVSRHKTTTAVLSAIFLLENDLAIEPGPYGLALCCLPDESPRISFSSSKRVVVFDLGNTGGALSAVVRLINGPVLKAGFGLERQLGLLKRWLSLRVPDSSDANRSVLELKPANICDLAELALEVGAWPTRCATIFDLSSKLLTMTVETDLQLVAEHANLSLSLHAVLVRFQLRRDDLLGRAVVVRDSSLQITLAEAFVPSPQANHRAGNIRVEITAVEVPGAKVNNTALIVGTSIVVKTKFLRLKPEVGMVGSGKGGKKWVTEKGHGEIHV